MGHYRTEHGTAHQPAVGFWSRSLLNLWLGSTKFYLMWDRDTFTLLLLREHTWSSREHAWSSIKSAGLMITRPSMLWVLALLKRACLCPWGRYLISIFFLDQSVSGTCCGECYNLCADGACAWPAANCARWSEMIVAISWQGNDNRQQRFDLMEMGYKNPIIIIILTNDGKIFPSS